MNLNYHEAIPTDFSDSSRVWIYQSNRLFNTHEALQIKGMLEQFVLSWKSHGETVKGYATLLFGHFIILMADETSTGVSGCSTDSSVRLIKDIEQRFGVNMFDRTTLAFVVKDKVQLLPLSQLQYAFDNRFIDSHTLYFNNLVQTKAELENKWLVPIKDSWLSKRITVNV